ncbi:serine protease [Flavobacteriales bacterium]|nr:serine protease [Flavobacteriales bacterium]
MDGQSDKRHFFTYRSQRYEIDRTSDNYSESTTVPMPQRENGKYRMEVEDYAFFKVDGNEYGTLEIESTINVGVETELILVTHSPKGEQIEFECSRKDEIESTELRLTGMSDFVEGTNLISIDADAAKKGHSGGPVMVKESNKVIGFLKGASRYRDSAIYDVAYIIKGQTILPKYIDLLG